MWVAEGTFGGVLREGGEVKIKILGSVSVHSNNDELRVSGVISRNYVVPLASRMRMPSRICLANRASTKYFCVTIPSLLVLLSASTRPQPRWSSTCQET